MSDVVFCSCNAPLRGCDLPSAAKGSVARVWPASSSRRTDVGLMGEGGLRAGLAYAFDMLWECINMVHLEPLTKGLHEWKP